MDHKDWLLLRTLSQEKNITKTADKLYLSQPSLTYRIQQLEKELHIPIITRSRRGIQFTEQGEYLVQYAEEMLLRYDALQEKLWNMDPELKGTLRLGVSNTIAAYKLPELLKPFLKQYPQVEVKVKTGWSSELVQAVQDRDVHIGFIRGDYPWKEGKHLLFEEHIALVSKREIHLEQLPFLPRINYQTDASLHAVIDQWWKDHYSSPPSVAMEVDTMETGKRMVLQDLGYAILPTIVLEPSDDLNIVQLLDRDYFPLTRNSWIIYKDDSLQLKLIDAFVAFVLQK